MVPRTQATLGDYTAGDLSALEPDVALKGR